MSDETGIEIINYMMENEIPEDIGFSVFVNTYINLIELVSEVEGLNKFEKRMLKENAAKAIV